MYDPAELLEHHLQERELTHAQFAERIGISRQSVTNVLTGQNGLSLKEWGRWFGALGLKLTFSTAPLGASMGFFVNREDAWNWLVKQLARRAKAKPLRSPGEFYDLLEQAGVLGWNPGLLPLHLKPLMESGWLWREGGDTTPALAARIRALLEERR